MKTALLSTLLLIRCLAAGSDFHKVSGTVRNAANEPIAFVHVSIEDRPSLLTTTNVKGQFEIGSLIDGSYVLIFTMGGFKTTKIPVIIRGADVEQNIILEDAVAEFKPVKVSNKKEDPSERIIRNVINNKYRFLYANPYTVDAYIKATELTKSQKKKKDTSKTETPSSLNISEVFLTVHFSPPDKIKEERKGVGVNGDKSGLFFLTHTDGDFNFYKNLVEVRALSETPFLSPISNSGLIAYKYRLLEIQHKDGHKFYRIKVQPGMLGNALFTGELLIQDSTWSVKSLKLSFPKYHLVEYDFFEIYQEFENVDSSLMLKKQEFNYEAKFGKQSSNGRTVVYYSNYRLNEKFKKRFFNTELSSTTQEAYERDSNFWSNIRLEPLSTQELAHIRKADSTRALRSQKYWQDSADSVYNRITWKKLLFLGQGNYKRVKEREWFFKPLIFLYTPVYIAGPRLNYWVYFSREYKNKKTVSVYTRANYGLLNKDLKGTVTLSRLYDPFRAGQYSVTVGSDFGIINPYNSWLRIFTRDNFYANDYGSVSHRIELFNGFYLSTGAEYSNRRPISNMKFDPRGENTILGKNDSTVSFAYYKALYANISLTYVPFQKYIREPYRKLVLGSSWPEFSIRYRKGFKTMGSTIDFDYWEFGIEKEIKVGLAGISKFRFVSGEFLNTKDVRLVDYKFQRSAGPIFFTHPLYAFQGLDTSYATFKRFYELHYLHRFNGSLINKIPLLKKLNIIEVAGAGMLYTHERNLKYVEVFVGFEKVIRLWKERLRIGVFFVAADSNKFNYPSQFKFTIEFFDKVNNKWPY